jgi:excisionase family DNA binding protein
MNTHDDIPLSSTIASTDAWELEPLIDFAELASYLGVPVSTVYDWRVHGKGPAAYRFGKHLKFAASDVRACVAEQREPSNQPGQPDRRELTCRGHG